MPVIPEVDEFINWDHTGPAVGSGEGDLNWSSPARNNSTPEQDTELDLVLENVIGDDFSFHALQYYEASQAVDPTLVQDSSLGFKWETPEAPCHHCSHGGYICKRIQEGCYKGYCTSCVALRCHCSFGPSNSKNYDSGETFPANPWPTLGDHPDVILDAGNPGDVSPPDILHSASAPDLTGLTSPTPPIGTEGGLSAAQCPKIGARFSRESVKILKNWLSTHGRRPYPTDEEKDALQRLTGLNKTQITNWLANARRRGKVRAPRSTSPSVRNLSDPIDIPQRRGTPRLESMNPLQRWQNSPPEHEPASVTAIARAVSASDAASSGLNSPHSYNYTEDGSARSLCHGSSASSIGTSQSSAGSFASAYSHASRNSLGSLGSLNRGRRRRRRRTAPKQSEDTAQGLVAPLKTFQCTFCTETFRTKHDWQRHEKSLHLSLERWVCAPDGPRTANPESKKMSCAFCGKAEPSDAHIESHNHSACQERSLDERTFYRKDHLRQHLKLVHNVVFLGWAMESWKVTSPQIRSRCGFCGIVMDSWSIRVDHLAEHFKTGNTMADWKGDWGFDAPVLDMVENSIPPYLIHDERNSPLPYQASANSPWTPRDAYELLKSELSWYITDQRDVTGRSPTDEDLHLEACRIIFGSEVLSKRPISADPSWVRDLILSSGEVCRTAKMRPIRGPHDSRMAHLRINGKDGLFQDCTAELALRQYAKSRQALGLSVTDTELQHEAIKIIREVNAGTDLPSDEVPDFLLRLITRSSSWLGDFRRRVSLPSSEVMTEGSGSVNASDHIACTMGAYDKLEADLAKHVLEQRRQGIELDDCELRSKARMLVYEQDDTFDQTAADNVQWLADFKQKYNVPLVDNAVDLTFPSGAVMLNKDAGDPSSIPPFDFTGITFDTAATTSLRSSPSAPLSPAMPNRGATSVGAGLDGRQPMTSTKTGAYFFNDANCYRRLARELGRWVNSTMSPNNPNRHVPTDEEMQHQARWILYDE
jgi:hypothetical protein